MRWASVWALSYSLKRLLDVLFAMSRRNKSTSSVDQERKEQIYLPSPEIRRQFRAMAADKGMTRSEFFFHLFQLFKRGELKQPDEKRDDA
jgi:hypothetical protein